MNIRRISLYVWLTTTFLSGVDVVAKAQGYEALGLTDTFGLWLGIVMTFLIVVGGRLPAVGWTDRRRRHAEHAPQPGAPA